LIVLLARESLGVQREEKCCGVTQKELSRPQIDKLSYH
jgi:hypothetical protein